MVSQRKPMSTTQKISGYELYARYFPAILTCIPLLLLSFYLAKGSETKQLLDFILSLKFFGYLSFSLILLYFYAQLIRTTSKVFEQSYFIHKHGFPTTYFMLYSDSTYSDAFKDMFRQRVYEVLGISLCTKKEEIADPGEAMKRLNEATKQIILSVGNGVLVGKHNQWYGFFRNLLGGCIYGAGVSVINVLLGCVFFISNVLTIASLILFVIYVILFLLRKYILVQHAEAYARQLLAEFMKV
jgi:hypothetical protein